VVTAGHATLATAVPGMRWLPVAVGVVAIHVVHAAASGMASAPAGSGALTSVHFFPARVHQSGQAFLPKRWLALTELLGSRLREAKPGAELRAFCTDMRSRQACKIGETVRRLYLLPVWHETDLDSRRNGQPWLSPRQ